MKPRCDQCVFWSYEHEDDERQHADEKRGTCHRNAPPATLGAFHHQVLWFLARNYERHDGSANPNEIPDWETFCGYECEWPTTQAQDWCGEFKPASKKSR